MSVAGGELSMRFIMAMKLGEEENQRWEVEDEGTEAIVLLLISSWKWTRRNVDFGGEMMGW